MKDVAMSLVVLVPSTVCFIIAGYMAINGIGYWGWFVFAGLLATPAFKYRSIDKEQ